MYINVVIPVCSLHVKYIEKCLDSIHNQTRIPDKVIIVAGEYFRYHIQYKQEFDKFNDKLNLVIVKVHTWEKPGVNRNIGSKHCFEGIIIYQDIDDLMNKHRCEYVGHCFETYKCSLLLHLHTIDVNKQISDFNESYVIKQDEVTKTMEEKSKLFSDEVEKFSYYFGDTNNKNNHSKIHHGMCCVDSNIFKDSDISWTNLHSGEDIKFVSDVTRKYKNTLILLIPLVVSVGTDHIRLIDNKIYHKKAEKQLDYIPTLSKSTKK